MGLVSGHTWRCSSVDIPAAGFLFPFSAKFETYKSGTMGQWEGHYYLDGAWEDKIFKSSDLFLLLEY